MAVAIVAIATGRGTDPGTSTLVPVTGESAPPAASIEGLDTGDARTLPRLGEPVRDGALAFVVLRQPVFSPGVRVSAS